MSVDPRISLEIVRAELAECEPERIRHGWIVSEIDAAAQRFTVEMVSPVDKERYILEVQFDNYREIPLLLDFIHPTSGVRGSKNAYPASSKKNGGFFHGRPCICHPASRTAYVDQNKGPHSDWVMAAWQSNPKTQSLKTLRPILVAIWYRIKDPAMYNGRMNG